MQTGKISIQPCSAVKEAHSTPTQLDTDLDYSDIPQKWALTKKISREENSLTFFETLLFF